MKNGLRRRIGGLRHEQKRPLKVLWYLPAEVLDKLQGRSRHQPPRWLRFDSTGDFRAVGEHLRDLCLEHGGLQPGDDVLDIGCGVGRLALPLAEVLQPESRYEGFDVDAPAIRWCKRHISSRWPNFSFTHVAVANEHYNRRSHAPASGLEFPYADESFDFAVATSLFTHLASADAARYLHELGRVLRPGATALLTWFVLDEDERAFPQSQFKRNFNHRLDEYTATDNPANPLAAIAFSHKFIEESCRKASLSFAGSVQLGSWRGGEVEETAPTHQDLLIVRRLP